MTAHDAALWFEAHYDCQEAPENRPAFCAGCGHWEFMDDASFDFGDDPVCAECAVAKRQTYEVWLRAQLRGNPLPFFAGRRL
jgi:hypothetical protein